MAIETTTPVVSVAVLIVDVAIDVGMLGSETCIPLSPLAFSTTILVAVGLAVADEISEAAEEQELAHLFQDNSLARRVCLPALKYRGTALSTLLDNWMTFHVSMTLAARIGRTILPTNKARPIALLYKLNLPERRTSCTEESRSGFLF